MGLGVARIQLVAASGWTSGLIERWGVARPEFSHVDIVLPSGRLLGARDDAFTIDAVRIKPGVRVRPPGYEKWVRRQVVEFHGHRGDISDAYDWALGMQGHKYDEDAILGIIFGQRWHRKGAFICSAFATEFMRRCGWVKSVFQPRQQISPNTVYAMAGAGGGIEVS